MSPELMPCTRCCSPCSGPPPAGEPNVNMPRELILKPGSQIVAIGDSITQAGGYLKDVDAVLAKKYPELKLPPIQNVGISGQKAEDLVKRFQQRRGRQEAGDRDDQRRDQRRLAPGRPAARPARAGPVLGQRLQDGRDGAKSGDQA